jgi:BMFP domain-containing protein YqiC
MLNQPAQATVAVMRYGRGGVKGSSLASSLVPNLASILRQGGRIAIVSDVGLIMRSRLAERPMTQTQNRFFDEVARLMNDAAGVASGVRREFDTLIRTQADRVLRDLDLVKREEFEAVKEMARLAREENEALHARIAALEARLAANAGAPAAPSPSSEPPPGGPLQPPTL